MDEERDYNLITADIRLYLEARNNKSDNQETIDA